MPDRICLAGLSLGCCDRRPYQPAYLAPNPFEGRGHLGAHNTLDDLLKFVAAMRPLSIPLA